MASTAQTATAIALISVISLGTLIYTYERDLCSNNGIWEPTGNQYEFYCKSEDSLRFCYKLSLSKRSCYIGRLEENSNLPVMSNGEVWECDGKNLYDICTSLNGKVTYYGELER
jgi:hypothetical protein